MSFELLAGYNTQDKMGCIGVRPILNDELRAVLEVDVFGSIVPTDVIGGDVGSTEYRLPESPNRQYVKDVRDLCAGVLRLTGLEVMLVDKRGGNWYGPHGSSLFTQHEAWPRVVKA
jgi:hypothetical protein